MIYNFYKEKKIKNIKKSKVNERFNNSILNLDTGYEYIKQGDLTKELKDKIEKDIKDSSFNNDDIEYMLVYIGQMKIKEDPSIFSSIRSITWSLFTLIVAILAIMISMDNGINITIVSQLPFIFINTTNNMDTTTIILQILFFIIVVLCIIAAVWIDYRIRWQSEICAMFSLYEQLLIKEINKRIKEEKSLNHKFKKYCVKLLADFRRTQ